MTAPRRRLLPDPAAVKIGEAIAAEWNRHVPIGAACSVINNLGEIRRTRTRSHAWALAHGTPVVLIEGHRGGYALERIVLHGVPIQEQAP